MDLFAIQRTLTTIPIDAGRPQFVGSNQVKNLNAFRNVVNRLAGVPPLARFANAIQSSPIFRNPADQFQTDPNAVAQLRQQSEALFAAAVTLKEILAGTVPEVPPETVVITLPSQKDLTTTTDFLQQFQKALAPLVFEPSIDGKIEVLHWQSGSLLVFIFVGTMAAISMIARTLQAAAIAYQEVQKGRATAAHVDLLKEHVKQEQIKSALASTIAEAQQERIKAVVDQQSRAVELEIFNNNENERLERIKHSVRTLADLFEQGATISPALTLPQAEQAKFPDVDHLLAVTPPIKQLEAAPPSEPSDSSTSTAAEPPTPSDSSTPTPGA
jgi:hypothetical protein